MDNYQAQTPRTLSGLLFSTLHFLGFLLVFLLGFFAYHRGQLIRFLLLLPMASVFVVLSVRLWGLFRKELAWSFIRHPLHRENRGYALQGLLQWAFWLSVGLALDIAFPSFIVGPEGLVLFRTILWGSIGALIVLTLFPNKRFRPSTSSFFAIALLYMAVELWRIHSPVSVADAVVLDLPFKGEWHVAQGGGSTLVNHHWHLRQQRHALDIGKPQKIGPEGIAPWTLDTHSAFGETLYAPAAGRVVKAVSHRPDMKPGETDSEQIVGNHITLDIGKGRYVLMAHLKRASVLVKPGDKVQRGQAIAQVGNSGNTSEPHLHLQVQSHADIWAKDLRTYPIRFHRVTRRRGWSSEIVEIVDLRRNDVVIREAEY